MLNKSRFYKTVHFFLTQIQVTLAGIFIIWLISLANHLFVYFIYCLPVLGMLMILEFLSFWYQKEPNQAVIIIVNMIVMVLSTIIFTTVFFLQFHPSASFEFTKIDKCKVVGNIASGGILGENYQLFYVDFEVEGQNWLGQACSSDLSQNYQPSEMVYQGQRVRCGSNKDNCTLFSKAGYQVSYNFTSIKLQSWLCMSNHISYDSLLQEQPCYVNYYGGSKAKENSKLRLDQQYLQDFAIIIFEEHPYFPKGQLICFIIFVFMPMILSLNAPFILTSNLILNSFNSICKLFNDKVLPQINAEELQAPPLLNSQQKKASIKQNQKEEITPENNQQLEFPNEEDFEHLKNKDTHSDNFKVTIQPRKQQTVSGQEIQDQRASSDIFSENLNKDNVRALERQATLDSIHTRKSSQHNDVSNDDDNTQKNNEQK